MCVYSSFSHLKSSSSSSKDFSCYEVVLRAPLALNASIENHGSVQDRMKPYRNEKIRICGVAGAFPSPQLLKLVFCTMMDHDKSRGSVLGGLESETGEENLSRSLCRAWFCLLSRLQKITGFLHFFFVTCHQSGRYFVRGPNIMFLLLRDYSWSMEWSTS